jgi:type VI secretion system protein ImpK
MFGRGKDTARNPRAERGSATRSRGPEAKAERRGILETFIGAPAVRPSAPPPRPRLTDLAAEWFSMAVALRRVTLLPDAETLHARAIELKDKFRQEAGAAGFSAADIEAAVYALVVFLDETVLSASGPGRDAWIRRPLQLELFGSNVGGEEFFNRLDRLRRERDTHIEALEIYFCCLAFGFAGKYMLSGPERLQSFFSEVERDIAAVRGTGKRALAPHALRQDEFGDAVVAGFPILLALGVFVAGMLIVWLLVVLVSHFGAGRAVADIHKLVTH